jgi:hypothetical protein
LGSHCTAWRHYTPTRDNILEGIRFVDALDKHSDHLSLIDEDFTNPAEPDFTLSSPDGERIRLVIRGEYRHWELPEAVSNAVDFIGRPDAVVVDKYGNQVVGGEFTDAAPIGNMILQREGRQVGLLRGGFPVVYDTAYTATDRSGSSIDPRFPPAMIVIVRLAYCLKYRIPAFITFYKNTDGERAAKEKYDDYPPQRKYDEGAKYLQNYLSSQLLNHVTGEYQTEVEEAQSDILHQMIEYLFETPVVRGSYTNRIEKDVPALSNADVLTRRREEFIDHLVDVINGRSEPKSEFAVTGFDPAEMVSWSGGHHKRKPLNKAVLDAGCEPQTFGSRQNPYIIDTDSFIEAVTSRYPTLSGELNKLDHSKETVVITSKFFQQRNSNCLVKVDPYSGSIAAFSEWLSRDLNNKKIRNVVVYSHSKCAVDDLEHSSKLKRSINQMSDITPVSVGADKTSADRWLFL